MRLDQFTAAPRFAGIDGRGFSTVIIDTGINLLHPFFGPDADANGVADRILYQYDFADNDASAADVDGHGSNVTSIAASGDSAYRGVASAAGIIALKVFSDSGAGNFASIERALQWTITHAAQYNIASVNLSLGDSGNYSTPQLRYGIADELAALAAMNVIVVAAAGNSFAEFATQGVSYPAADPSVISVGAVYSASYGGFTYGGGASAASTGPDRIAPFSQRSAPFGTIFAPGAPVAGAGPASGTITLHGTSQASPQIAGIAVLAQQLAIQALGRRLSPLEFHQMLFTSAASIIDGDDEDDSVTNTGATFRRADVLALGDAILNLVPPPPPEGNLTPTLSSVQTLRGAKTNRAGLISFNLLMAASNEADANGDAIRFRVSSVESGVLFRNGRLVMPGQTLVGPGDWLIYFPAPNVSGTVAAFSIKAFDGYTESAAAQVRIEITQRSLFASRVSQQGGMNDQDVLETGPGENPVLPAMPATEPDRIATVESRQFLSFDAGEASERDGLPRSANLVLGAGLTAAADLMSPVRSGLLAA